MSKKSTTTVTIPPTEVMGVVRTHIAPITVGVLQEMGTLDADGKLVFTLAYARDGKPMPLKKVSEFTQAELDGLEDPSYVKGEKRNSSFWLGFLNVKIGFEWRSVSVFLQKNGKVTVSGPQYAHFVEGRNGRYAQAWDALRRVLPTVLAEEGLV